ncbi:MAG: cation:dicarboxylase symporter family transporter [Vicinamibacterales bacterium]|nr:cation:dicarboxylase symporter family transporter [Vicinamibacterales bacterium]
MTLGVLANLALVLAALVWLARRARAGAPLSQNVLVALVLGVALGAGLQAVYGVGHAALVETLTWVNVVGGGYVRLLQMVVMPLVLISILAAVARLGDARALGAIAGGVLGLLMVTTAVSAVIGIVVTRLFGLTADGLVQGARELARGEALASQLGQVSSLSIPALLLSFVPVNIVSDLSGARSTSVISVVIFAALLGLAVLALRRENPEVGARVAAGIETLQHLIMRLVRLVIRLTPYGVFALMTRVVAMSNLDDVINLGGFVVASYLGMAVILLMHAGLLALAGLNPVRYFQKVWPVLTFAFSSRSSAAAIPMSVETQVSRLGVSPAIANFAASFGATIGQNACAGLYPAMLAVMIAPGAGIDPTSLSFLGTLVLVATLGSFGIAGVGGGATFAALIVLSTLNLPVALAGLLISVEPLIDMGRTAVNVSGSMTAGAVTSRALKQTDMGVFGAGADAESVAAPAAAEPGVRPALPVA